MEWYYVWWPWLTSKRVARVCHHQLSFLLKDLGRRISAQVTRERVRFCSKVYLFSYNDLTLSCSTTVLTWHRPPGLTVISAFIFLTNFLFPCPRYRRCIGNLTRSSADADNRLDAFSGQSRSTNMVPFHMLHIVSYCAIVTLRYSSSKNFMTLKWGQRSLKVIESGIIR